MLINARRRVAPDAYMKSYLKVDNFLKKYVTDLECTRSIRFGDLSHHAELSRQLGAVNLIPESPQPPADVA
jgi:hypothetical protein